MDNSLKENIKRRLLSPRIIIYSAIAVGLAWFMTHYSAQKAQAPRAVQPPVKTWKDVETVQEKCPMILVFESSENTESLKRLEDIVEEAGKDDGRHCAVALVAVDNDVPNTLLEAFGVTALPCAVLIDGNNREVAKIQGESITAETLEALKGKLPPTESSHVEGNNDEETP